jgi:hypothetical protein
LGRAGSAVRASILFIGGWLPVMSDSVQKPSNTGFENYVLKSGHLPVSSKYFHASEYPMSLIKFVASVRAHYQPHNEQDGVQIMNRLRELLESNERTPLKEPPEAFDHPTSQYKNCGR